MSYIVDGKEYEKTEDIPDLGSWECVSVEPNGTRSYYGKSMDLTKLPKYEDLKTSSTAYCIDTGDLYMYHNPTKTWIEQ